MNRLEEAIAREDWELAAHYLLLGMVRALDKLPPETYDALLQLLDDEERSPHPHRRRDRVRRSRRARGAG